MRSCRSLPGDNKKRMDQELSPEDVIKISSILKHFLFLTLWYVHPALYCPVFWRRSGSTSFTLFKLMHHCNYKINWCSSVKSIKWYSWVMWRLKIDFYCDLRDQEISQNSRLLEEGSIVTWQTTLSAIPKTVVGREHSRLTSTQT